MKVAQGYYENYRVQALKNKGELTAKKLSMFRPLRQRQTVTFKGKVKNFSIWVPLNVMHHHSNALLEQGFPLTGAESFIH